MEVSSFELMRKILEYGYFHVGSSTVQSLSSTYEAIRLTVKGCQKVFAKPKFSLDDLKDLESKLVLITGRNAEYRNQVDQYLDVSVTSV